MKPLISSGLLGAALLWAGAANAQTVDLSSVEVKADLSVRIAVAVAGDMTPGTMIVSAPTALHCGAGSQRYDTKSSYQCWTWARKGRPMLLAAQSNGGYGTEWTVAWTGCEPVDNGAVCKITPNSEVLVAATFSRKHPPG